MERLPELRPDSLDRFAAALASAGATRSRLEKRRVLGEYLHSLPEEALAPAVTFLTGRPFPRAEGRKLSIGGATLSRALLAAHPGTTPEELHAAWLRHSDAGDAAADVWGRRCSIASLSFVVYAVSRRWRNTISAVRCRSDRTGSPAPPAASRERRTRLS